MEHGLWAAVVLKSHREPPHVQLKRNAAAMTKAYAPANLDPGAGGISTCAPLLRPTLLATTETSTSTPIPEHPYPVSYQPEHLHAHCLEPLHPQGQSHPRASTQCTVNLLGMWFTVRRPPSTSTVTPTNTPLFTNQAPSSCTPTNISASPIFPCVPVVQIALSTGRRVCSCPQGLL